MLNNACKFTPPGGQITITAASSALNAVEPAEILELAVTNSRVEIPASELPLIFERFYRIPNRDRWKHTGTGLGLALVKKLVEHLGGSIAVKSSNRQTCFTVTILIDTLGMPKRHGS